MLSVPNEAAAQRLVPLDLRPGEGYSDAWHRSKCPEDLAQMDANARHALLSGQPGYRQEFRCHGSDGYVRWLEEDVRLERVGDGRWKAVGVCLDITERKSAEAALTASEARHHRVLETVREVLFQTDRFGKWVFLNSAWEHLTGFSVRESLGRNVLDCVIEADRPGLIAALRPLLKATADQVEHDVRYRTRDGGIRWVSIHVQALRDDRGRVVGSSGLIHDHTERRLAAEALERSEKRFRALVQHSSDVTAILDTNGVITYVSPGVTSATGFTCSELTGKQALQLVHPADRRDVQQVMWDLLQTDHGTAAVEIRIRTCQGEWRTMRAVMQNLMHEPAILGLVINASDVTEQRSYEAELARHAFYDPVTQLANRALFSDRLTVSIARRRAEGELLAVMFLDLDRFKMINDVHGHAVGDEILLQVARRLRACVRDADTVARFGGDEFTILLDRVEHRGDAEAVAERILRWLNAPFHASGRQLRINASIGIVLSDGRDKTSEDLLRNADVSLYRAKAGGKGRFVLFDERMSADVAKRLELETDLYRAFEQDELVLQYQPEYDLRTRRLVGAEALLRWRHPRLGLIQPGQFLPIAEETGQILRVGEWVQHRVVQQARRWNEHRTDGPLFLGMNLSTREFHSPHLLDSLRDLLVSHPLDRLHLQVEVTESMLIDDIDAAIHTLREMKSLGVQIAVDDFGTGYSSLGYLSRLPVDALKIDRSFVSQICQSEASRSIVRAILGMAAALGLTVTGEGIETEAQAKGLRDLGCPIGQGFYFAPPLSPEELDLLIRESVGAPRAFSQLAAGS